MSVNIGDKVRFLREVGGGIVTGFRKGGLILVEDEDGFEIPMLEGDLVVIPNAASGKDLEQTSSTRKSQPAVGASGTKFPKADSDIAKLEERIEQLERLVQKLSQRVEQLESVNALRAHARKTDLSNNGNDKKLGKNDIIEIDLHAHALLDSTEGLSAVEIKDYQMKVFREKMEQFRREKGRRLVFIHGNGDGVLRKAILTELKYTYKTCRHQDASFQQYGFGATMVTMG